MKEAKQRVWGEFREAMEKDFRLATSFWKTVRHHMGEGDPSKLCKVRVGFG